MRVLFIWMDRDDVASPIFSKHVRNTLIPKEPSGSIIVLMKTSLVSTFKTSMSFCISCDSRPDAIHNVKQFFSSMKYTTAPIVKSFSKSIPTKNSLCVLLQLAPNHCILNDTNISTHIRSTRLIFGSTFSTMDTIHIMSLSIVATKVFMQSSKRTLWIFSNDDDILESL